MPQTGRRAPLTRTPASEGGYRESPYGETLSTRLGNLARVAWPEFRRKSQNSAIRATESPGLSGPSGLQGEFFALLTRTTTVTSEANRDRLVWAMDTQSRFLLGSLRGTTTELPASGVGSDGIRKALRPLD